LAPVCWTLRLIIDLRAGASFSQTAECLLHITQGSLPDHGSDHEGQRFASMDPSNMPVAGKRMFRGGFKVRVKA